MNCTTVTAAGSLLLILAANHLTGCTAAPVVVCPEVATLSRAYQTQLAGEIEWMAREAPDRTEATRAALRLWAEDRARAKACKG